MLPLKINPSHITIVEQLDRELRLHLTDGRVLVVNGSNEFISNLASELSADFRAIQGETATRLVERSTLQ